MRIGVICGGPSAERGISLNSARSAMDHLTPLGWDITPFYCDQQNRFFRLSPAQLYSNTPSDFDFKLAQTSLPLTEGQFIAACRDIDMIFPAIHGAFGEDGALQKLLEANNIPFVGSSAKACSMMFDKAVANRHMAQHGFATLPHCRIDSKDAAAVQLQKITDFFTRYHIEKAVVKPSAGGSSLGVATAHTPQEAAACAQQIFTDKHGTQALIEPYCKGREFTVVVVQSLIGEPVAFIPTEIELIGGDLFSFRHKYLPTCHVEYHCPPRFPDDTIKSIQTAAEVLYWFFEMRDFARLDGWLLDDGSVIFSDFNPISGMEQNSHLFIQGSRIGYTHSDLLRHIVTRAASRYDMSASVKPIAKKPDAKKVRVLFGGATAERQVSLMSGTNVWLKLLHHPDYDPEPYILAANQKVWQLPYSFTLNHTVEEILQRCVEAPDIIARLRELAPPLRERLGDLPSSSTAIVTQPKATMAQIVEDNADDNAFVFVPLQGGEEVDASHNTAMKRCADVFVQPRRMTLDQFCHEAADQGAFVFDALHGGEGEDGALQAVLESYRLAYNGSGPLASRLCMDKNETGAVINALNDPLLTSTAKLVVSLRQAETAESVWAAAQEKLKTSDIIIKPQADGCSAGVVRLQSMPELKLYLNALAAGQPVLAAGTLPNQPAMIELPQHADAFILEPFIATDDIRVEGGDLVHTPRDGWIELTVGVTEEDGITHALTPSITVAQSHVLSLEEKFQGGTGVNLTPPPATIIPEKLLGLIKVKIEQAAKALGIQGYARIDIFFNIRTEQTIVIEANTLPGLTPSTVIYHQALAESPPLTPQQFLASLVELGRHKWALAQAQRLKSR